MGAHGIRHAGDAIIRRHAVAAPYTAADRILVRPEPLGECTANDSACPAEIILGPLGRVAAHRNAQRLEVARRHLHHLHAVAAFAGWTRDVDDRTGAQLRALER